jgi:diacylglycerol kinase (ATP)
MWLLILNPTSGGGATLRKQGELEVFLQKNAIPYTLRLTQHAQHATELVRNAIEREGFRQIAAVGGDGTLNEVVNGAMQQTAVPTTDLLLAAIPLGTGNDWIRTHGIPSDWQKAALLLKTPKTKPHDVGLVHFEGKKSYFINIAGMAYDAFVVRYMTEKSRAAWLPRTIQYFYLIVRCLFAYVPQRVKVTLDDGTTIDEDIYTVHVGICRYSGGGCTMTPHALHDDGLFAVTVIRKVSVWNALLSTPMFYNGKIGQHKQATTHSAKTVTISPTLVELDGELCAPTEISTRFEVLPLSLNVVVGA